MTRTPVRWFPVLLLALLLAACGGIREAETGEPSRRRDSNVITRDEILSTNLADAYDVVRNLRPGWLRRRGQMSVTQPSDIVVYLDNMHLGGPEALRSISALDVRSMEFLNAAAATHRWGTGHVHGAILISTM